MADKLLKSIKFPTLPDRYVIGDSTLTEEGAAAEAKAVGEALATKADTKGTYEDLIVGGAEQLMADGYETDKEPYLFRTTGGSADVGNREYLDKIVGGTVAWNQLVHNGDFASTSNWETYRCVLSTANNIGTITATGVQVIFYQILSVVANHKYLMSADVKADKVHDSAYYTFGNSQKIKTYSVGTDWANVSVIESANATLAQTAVNFIRDPSGTVADDVFYIRNAQLIDLTAMFGSTIADYIYSLEQSQAGAGVAWFRNYFPKDYYPYDPGTLRSVEGVSAHETVGFNQWDEEWESGTYLNVSGAKYPSSTKIRNVNPIKVFPGTAYYWHVGSTSTDEDSIFCYDADMNFIQRFSFSHGTTLNIAFTTPSNCEYINLSINNTTYNHDICINLSDPTRNGEYEPYQKHTYQLDSSLTLRGMPKLVDGKLEFDGDVYPPSGEVDRRYGVVDLGTLDWSVTSSVLFRTSGITDYKRSADNATKANALSIYSVIPLRSLNGPSSSNPSPNMVCAFGSTENVLYVNNTSYTDAGAFKAAMSGVYLVYELATPTTETADGYEQYQRCDPSGTEQFVTDGIVPVGHETRYPHDLKKKIETAPDSPSTDGTYLMKRSGGKNTYMALPSTPSANGAYVLTVTVSGGTASYSWTAKE